MNTKKIHPLRTPDLIGTRFGYLTVIARNGHLYGKVAWTVECECGVRFDTTRNNLIQGRTRSCGDHKAHPASKAGQNMTYGAVHELLRKRRGSASTHACVDCGGKAHEWSYDGGSDEERATVGGHRYATDLDAYSPRCRRCHLAHDKAMAKPPLPLTRHAAFEALANLLADA